MKEEEKETIITGLTKKARERCHQMSEDKLCAEFILNWWWQPLNFYSTRAWPWWRYLLRARCWNFPNNERHQEEWWFLDRRAISSSNRRWDGSKMFDPFRIHTPIVGTIHWQKIDMIKIYFLFCFSSKKLTSLSSRVYFDWLALKLFSKIRVVTLADCSWACNSRTCFWRTMLDSSRKRVFSIKSSVACWCCGLIGDAIPATISSCNTWYSTS